MRLLAKVATLGAVAGVAQGSFFSRKGEAAEEEAPVSLESPCQACCDTCPLSSLGVGQACRLLDVGAGRRLRRRLAELGLTPGVQMTVLQNTGGPVLICVRNSRLALGRQMAHKLDVQPLQGEDD